MPTTIGSYYKDKTDNKVRLAGTGGRPGADLMIDAATATTQGLIDADKTVIEGYDKKIVAWVEFQNLLQTLKKSADALRNPSSYDSEAESNIFKSRDTTLMSSAEGTYPAANYISVPPYNGIVAGSHTISSIVLATQANTVYSGFTSLTANAVTGGNGFFTAGTFQINGENITLVSGDTLISVKDKINSLNSLTSVTASIQSISSNSYLLTISSDDTGTSNAYTIVDAGGVLTQLTTSSSSLGSNASFIFDNQLTSRDLNVITDLLPSQDFTLTLKASTPVGLSINIGITKNPALAMEGITSFMKSYNDIMRFVYQQTEKDPTTGEYAETAILARDTNFTNIATRLNSNLIQSVSGLSSNSVSSLAEIGIIFANSKGNLGAKEQTPANNILAFSNDDITILENALSTNLDAVSKIFEFNAVPSSGYLKIRDRSNFLVGNMIYMDIDTSRTKTLIGNDYIQDIVRMRNTVNGEIYRPNVILRGANTYIIKGQSGSPFEGITMAYNGPGVETITIPFSQGLADKMYNYLGDLVQNTNSAPYKQVDDLKNNKRQYDANGNVIKKSQPSPSATDLHIKAIQDSKKNINDKIIKNEEKMKNEADAARKKASQEGAEANTADNLKNRLETELKFALKE